MFIGAIDQGTSSTRFAIIDESGAVIAMAQAEHRQIYPHPGHVEHDPAEILARVEETAAACLAEARLVASDLAAVGVTNQRETTILWDKRTGRPLFNALVWQDTRVDAAVAKLQQEVGGDHFRARTGLPLASYFSALKLQWILDHVPYARALAETGDALFGTVDSWLAWHLTGRHVTDVTNASRTQLMDLATLDWAPDLCAQLRIPMACLPRIVPTSGVIAPIATGVLAGAKLAALVGDQQAALIGQRCLAPGDAKNTYGTGNFLLMNTGDKPILSQAGLITTVAYQFGEDPAIYALEGSIAVTGALLQWLRDGLKLVASAPEVDALAAQVDDSAGVYIVPAFSGLYAPYWRADARGVIVGLTGYSDRRHLCRAALEAAAFQTRDVADAMAQDAGHALRQLRVDGGLARSDILLQFQADLLGVEVVRPQMTESTVLGAAIAAARAVGGDIAPASGAATRFVPQAARDGAYRGWRRAVEKSLNLADDISS